MTEDLERHKDGSVVVRPVTGWSTTKAAGILGILRVEYIESPQEFGGKERYLQMALTAPQCLELAEKLTILGKSLLQTPAGTPQ